MHGARCPVCRDFVRDLRLAQGAWLVAALATPDARATVACGRALLLRRVDAWMTEEVSDSSLYARSPHGRGSTTPLKRPPREPRLWREPRRREPPPPRREPPREPRDA